MFAVQKRHRFETVRMKKQVQKLTRLQKQKLQLQELQAQTQVRAQLQELRVQTRLQALKLRATPHAQP